MSEICEKLALVVNSVFEDKEITLQNNEKFFIVSRAVNIFYVHWFENMGRQFDNEEYEVTFKKRETCTTGTS